MESQFSDALLRSSVPKTPLLSLPEKLFTAAKSGDAETVAAVLV